MSSEHKGGGVIREMLCLFFESVECTKMVCFNGLTNVEDELRYAELLYPVHI